MAVVVLRTALVEAAFVAEVEAIGGIASVFDHEPKDLGPFPCVTMLFTDVAQNYEELGPVSENEWEWRVNLYISLIRGAEAAYKEAQNDLQRLLPEILAIPRRNMDLSGTCSWASLSGQGREPVFDHTAGYLVKSMRLAARSPEF